MLINQSAEIIEKSENKINNIANIARVCYKSEANSNNANNARLVENLIKNHHYAMLEHEDLIFKFDSRTFNEIVQSVSEIEYTYGINLYLFKTKQKDEKYGIISGNISAWRKFWKYSFLYAKNVLGEKEIYVFMLDYFKNNIFFKDIFDFWDVLLDIQEYKLPDVKILNKNDLSKIDEKLAHYRISAKIITDRGISHELVRHRTFSFAQESTRYVNYQNKGMQFINYANYANDDIGDGHYIEFNNAYSEYNYNKLIEFNNPEIARSVLPHNLKTELVMTGNLHSWCHFFNLRLFERTGKAHPMIKDIAHQLFMDFEKKTPISQDEIINICEQIWGDVNE